MKFRSGSFGASVAEADTDRGNGRHPPGLARLVAAAGATAKTGPDLGNLSADAARAGPAVAAFTRQSIVEPNAYVEKGYPPNVMPHTYGSSLSSKQLDALVDFLLASGRR